MNKISTWLASGLLLAATQVSAEGKDWGHEGKWSGMRQGMGGPEQILKKLDLSEVQKEKLKELRKARRDKSQARKNALHDAREDMKGLLAKVDRSKGHEDKLRAKHAEIAKLEAEQGDDRFESMLEVRNILNDAQLKKFIELKENGDHKWGKWNKDGKGGKDQKDGKRP